MKTNEFIKRVKQLGLHVEEDRLFIRLSYYEHDVFVTVVIGNMQNLIEDKVDIIKLVDAIRASGETENYGKGYEAKSVSRLFYSGHELERSRIRLGDHYKEYPVESLLFDLLVVCQVWGLELEDCIESAYNEISIRKGKMINGTFVKESDLDE